MPGLVPGIQPSTRAGAGGWMDPGDKRRDDTGYLLSESEQKGLQDVRVDLGIAGLDHC